MNGIHWEKRVIRPKDMIFGAMASGHVSMMIMQLVSLCVRLRASWHKQLHHRWLKLCLRKLLILLHLYQHWQFLIILFYDRRRGLLWQLRMPCQNFKFSPLFSYVRNTYPNEKKEGGDFWHKLEKGWELVLQREERRRGCLTGSMRKVYQFLPRKLVGKSISSFSKCLHLPNSERQNFFC